MVLFGACPRGGPNKKPRGAKKDSAHPYTLKPYSPKLSASGRSTQSLRAIRGSTGPTEMGFGFRVQGQGLRVWGLGFRVEGLGFRFQSLRLRTWGSRLEDLGFQGFRI